MRKLLFISTLLVSMVLNISCGEDKKKDDNKDEKGFISAREELEANGWSYMGDVRFVSTFSEVEDDFGRPYAIYEKDGNYIRIDIDIYNNNEEDYIDRHTLKTIRDAGFIQSVTRGNFYHKGKYYTWSAPNSYGR
ncbi:MAG: hypothetical protein J6C56_06335 [Alistipes sp.]|nr:hypothetical protein [Alistipes sp.]